MESSRSKIFSPICFVFLAESNVARHIRSDNAYLQAGIKKFEIFNKLKTTNLGEHLHSEEYLG